MSELIQNFGLDWRLLLAQAVNFFVLLFILKKFAYGPILRMLRQRREKIEQGVRFSKEAEKKIAEIDILREEEMRRASADALAVVSSAEDTAKNKKAEIIDDAHRKVDSVIADAKRVIIEEKAKMREDAYKDAEGVIRSGLERVLGKIPPEVRDKKLIQEALKELRGVM